MNGQIIDGKYQLVRLLGQGGMGVVYDAWHLANRRRVAVKIVSHGRGKEDGELTARFHREVKAASAIDSAHIAATIDSGTDPETGAPYLVMEYLEGEDLQQLIRRLGPLPPPLALRIVAQACIGLDKAHEAHIVHRDIKPGNLFLARRQGGEIIVKLLDFGVAKIKGEDGLGLEAELTRTGATVGSLHYMSPEQVMDARNLDYRTDLWSLGIVLYCALGGQAPFAQVRGLPTLVAALHAGRPPSIREIAPWVSPEIAAVVHGALEAERSVRFQSAVAMFTAVTALLPEGWTLTEEMLVARPAPPTASVPEDLNTTMVSEHLPAPAPQPAREATLPLRPPSLRPPSLVPSGSSGSSAPDRPRLDAGRRLEAKTPAKAALPARSARSEAKRDARRSHEDLPFPAGESPFRVKGVFYRGNIEYIEQAVPGGLAAVREAIRDPALRAFFEQPFLASDWYDVFPLVAVSYPSARLAKRSLAEYIRERARYQAAQQSSGVYRSLLGLSGIAAVARKLPLVASQLYNFGSTEARTVSDTEVEVSRRGLPAVLLAWYLPGTESYITAALTHSGATNARAHSAPFEPTGKQHGLEIGTVRHVFSWDKG